MAPSIIYAGAEYCLAAKRNTSVQIAVANRRLKAAWDEDYLTQTVFG